MKILRLRCECSRNLADVTRPTFGGVATNPAWTADGLVVTPRPNVTQDDHRPWPRHDPAADWHHRTYTWRCRCERVPQVRHERISAVWAEHADDAARVVVVVVGREL